MTGDGTKYGTGNAPVDRRGVPLVGMKCLVCYEPFLILQYAGCDSAFDKVCPHRAKAVTQ